MPSSLLCVLFCFLFAIVQGQFPSSNSTAGNGTSTNDPRAQRCERARKFVSRINNMEIGDGKWKAIFHERFAAMNDTQRRKMHGLINMAFPGSSSASNSSSSAQAGSSNNSSQSYGGPRRTKRATTCSYSYAFDARTAWPNCSAIIGSIRDQSGCGGCWAVASASVFTDRYCIARLKAGTATSATNASNFFSDADVLSCSPSSYGCDGGSPYYAFQYMKSTGVVTGTNYTWNAACKPYPFPPNSNSVYTAPSCASKCTNSKYTTAYASDKKYASTTGYMQGSTATVAKIQAEIKANGPVVASMEVYDDFYYYSSGVYKQTSSTYEGGHAVRLIGWGTQTCSDGTSQAFWLAVNSWNTDWGMSGLFMIASGSNMVGIEQNGIFYGVPKI